MPGTSVYRLEEILLWPIRLRAHDPDLKAILFEGSKRAREVAGQTMSRVRDAVKIAYR